MLMVKRKFFMYFFETGFITLEPITTLPGVINGELMDSCMMPYGFQWYTSYATSCNKFKSTVWQLQWEMFHLSVS